ncbi:MAG: Smr/MutS family protein, partial [Alteraurantiacibacter sp.]
MTAPRGLNPDEQAAWERLAQTVDPINPPPEGEGDRAKRGAGAPSARSPTVRATSITPSQKTAPTSAAPRPPSSPPSRGQSEDEPLNTHWQRRLARSSTEPDFTLDLHGHTLDQAYRRLDDGLVQAKAMGARLVLVVTGKYRPVDAADRGSKRGAIRAKILDWLAAGRHASDISAV